KGSRQSSEPKSSSPVTALARSISDDEVSGMMERTSSPRPRAFSFDIHSGRGSGVNVSRRSCATASPDSAIITQFSLVFLQPSPTIAELDAHGARFIVEHGVGP